MRKLPDVYLTPAIFDPSFLPFCATHPIGLPEQHWSGVSSFPKKHLYQLLVALRGVRQDPRYHPEGDALYHSLQVFQLAYRSTRDPVLWAAALLHDIGKARHPNDHARGGAEELRGVLSSRIVWLIQHHLHLLRAPKRTRRWLQNTPQLRDLELLRKWDTQGRCPFAVVMAPNEALNILLQHASHLLPHYPAELAVHTFDWNP